MFPKLALSFSFPHSTSFHDERCCYSSLSIIQSHSNASSFSRVVRGVSSEDRRSRRMPEQTLRMISISRWKRNMSDREKREKKEQGEWHRKSMLEKHRLWDARKEIQSIVSWWTRVQCCFHTFHPVSSSRAADVCSTLFFTFEAKTIDSHQLHHSSG